MHWNAVAASWVKNEYTSCRVISKHLSIVIRDVSICPSVQSGHFSKTRFSRLLLGFAKLKNLTPSILSVVPMLIVKSSKYFWPSITSRPTASQSLHSKYSPFDSTFTFDITRPNPSTSINCPSTIEPYEGFF